MNYFASQLSKLRTGCKERKSRKKKIASRLNGMLGGRPKGRKNKKRNSSYEKKRSKK